MAFGLVYGLMTRFGPGSTATWASAMLPTMGAALFWFAATPVIAGTARRIRATGQPWWVRIALHAVPCAFMVLATAGVMWGIRSMVAPNASPYWVRLFLSGDLSVIQYVVVVILFHAWDRHLALAEHERRGLVLEQQLVGARLLYLERQLRPHFLFNCLNAIAEMAHVSTASAAHMLASLRKLLTSAVETAGRTVVPLREELATLDAYLELQRARFMGSIEVEHYVVPEALDAAVPPLLLQPVVENAIQHGLDRVDGRGHVRIAVTVHAGRLRIEVEDNGAAGPPSSPRGFGIGLRNTRERIETLYGEQGCSLELELRPSGGAVTRIELPLSAAPPREVAAADVFDESTDAEPVVAEVAAAAPLPAPIITRLPIVWLVCLLVPFAWSAQIYGLYRSLGRTAVFELSGPDMVAGAAWLILAPCALYLAERFPVRGGHVRRNLALHLVAAVTASYVEGVIVTSTGLLGDRPVFAAVNAPQRIIGMLVYLALVAWMQVDVFARWYHERGVVSARLRAALERARWRAATLELQPTLVLSALDAAERQVVVSVDDAEKTLYQLSDLLRSQLDLSRDTLIPLDAEVRQIASAQRLRELVEDGAPHVEMTIPTQLASVRVPSGVVRRLVQAVCAEVRGPSRIELRLDGIRYLRHQMEMRLSLIVDGQPLTVAATELVRRRLRHLDVALGHPDLHAESPGVIVVLTDLGALEASEAEVFYPDALRSGESVAAIISTR